MTANVNTCHPTKTGNIITCQGRLMYPDFFQPSLPRGETDESKAKYQGTLIFPTGADLALLAEKVEEAAIEKWGAAYKQKHKVKKPFGKAEEQPKMGATAEAFPIFIRANSKDRPQVMTASGLIISPDGELLQRDPAVTDRTAYKVVGRVDIAAEVYPGRWARFSLRPYAYDHPTGGKGVSLGLQNVQILDHDERLAGARPQATDEFEAVATAGGAPASTDQLFD